MSFTVKKFGGQIHDRFENIQEQFSNLSTKAQENISGIRVIKAFAREESEIEEFGKLNRGLCPPQRFADSALGAVLSADDGPDRTVFRSPALVWRTPGHPGTASPWENLSHSWDTLAMLTWPTIAVGWVINIFQRGAASMGRILEIMDVQPGNPG